MNSSALYPQQAPLYNTPGNFQNVQQSTYQQMDMANRQQINQRQVAMTGGVSQVQQQSQQQQQQVVLERTPATAMMGFPGEIRQITNPKTQQVEVVQTCMIVVELQSNQWGYGINLNDSDGVVRIEGKRANNDGTPSPAQQNSNIEKGDVIYKVQNVVLGRNNPLNVVRTMSGKCYIGCSNNATIKCRKVNITASCTLIKYKIKNPNGTSSIL